MAPYLPQSGAAGGGGGSPYSEGGALYALGLIHANHGEGIKQFLRDSLRSTSVEVFAFYNHECSYIQFAIVIELNFRNLSNAGYSAWCLSWSWLGSFRDC